MEKFINLNYPNYQEMFNSLQDPSRRKMYFLGLIKEISEELKMTFVKKIKTGKINQEYTKNQMIFLSDLILEYNQIQVYEIKNNIVIPRNLNTFPTLSFLTDLTKGNCQKNIDQLMLLK